MRFLPDSAVLGFAKRLKNAGKPRRSKARSVGVEKGKSLASSRRGYEMDTRSYEQLLAEARRHAEKSGK